MRPALAFGLLLAVSADERRKVPVVCPLDGTSFTAIEVVTTNQWGGIDADFCPHAYKTTPLEFRVWTCPSCGFTGRKADFGARLPEEEKKALREGLSPAEPIRKGAAQSEIPGHVKYDLWAQVLRIRGAPPEEIGRAWLHASWSCRQQGAIELDGFDEWETLRESYGLNQPPLQLGRKNRTELDLEAARKIARDVEGGRHERGVSRTLARYLAAFLFRKHGENGEAEAWLKSLEALKGENSVVEEAAGRMRASIERERGYQKKALEAFTAALGRGGRNSAEIAYLTGELHRRLGDREAAAAAYLRALAASPAAALRDLILRQKALVEK